MEEPWVDVKIVERALLHDHSETHLFTSCVFSLLQCIYHTEEERDRKGAKNILYARPESGRYQNCPYSTGLNGVKCHT